MTYLRIAFCNTFCNLLMIITSGSCIAHTGNVLKKDDDTE